MIHTHIIVKKDKNWDKYNQVTAMDFNEVLDVEDHFVLVGSQAAEIEKKDEFKRTVRHSR